MDIDLRAPDPLGYKAPKMSNPASIAAGSCTSFGPLLTNISQLCKLWSGMVRVESIHPDQKTRATTGLVRVVRVVRAKSNIIHMRARTRVSLFFLHIVSILRLEFEFVRNTPDHPDQANHSADSRPDHPPGPTRTTRTTPVIARLSAFLVFVGGGKRSKSRPKWSGYPYAEASAMPQSGGN
jgi:hypothetical protein